MKVLVFIEQRNAQMKQSAFELLNAASQVTSSKADIAAVVIGSGVSNIPEMLNGAGVTKVFVADDSGLERYNNASYVSCIERITKIQCRSCVGCSITHG